jgi:SAM-dependent methyltransferase
MKKKIGFSSEWENIYKSNIHLSIWPWSEVVTLVNQYSKSIDDYKNVLEIGCGAGANIPFFISRGNNYYGVDGSKIIISRLKKKFPLLKKKLLSCDFTKNINFKKKFDIIIDRGSLTHNKLIDINSCLKILSSKVRESGIYIGVDLFSSNHSSSKLGKRVDKFTRSNIHTNQFRGVGNVHFFTKKNIFNLFKNNNFKIIHLEHINKKNLIKNKKEEHSVFNVIAKKLR